MRVYGKRDKQNFPSSCLHAAPGWRNPLAIWVVFMCSLKRMGGRITADVYLLVWLWPWPDDLHIQTSPTVFGDTPDVQIWTSYIKAFKSYQLTDTYIHTEAFKIIYTMQHQGWSINRQQRQLQSLSQISSINTEFSNRFQIISAY